MSAMTCADAADRLPDWAAARLAADEAARVAAHVAACAECAAQAELVRALRTARSDAPSGLAVRVAAELRAAPVGNALPRRRAWRAWAGSAAAVLVLVFGARFARRDVPVPEGPSPLGQIALDESVWIADDGIVAGAPVLDELPEEQLAALLEEMGG